jgi:hypothetical protein
MKSMKCSSKEELLQFLLGKKAGPEDDGILVHLRSCPSCLDTLHALEAQDTFFSMVKKPGLLADPSELQGIDVAGLKIKVKAMSAACEAETIDPSATPPSTSGSSRPAEAAPSLDFLAPPQRPDEIGRLGNYRILKLLGQGGMGMVFQAEDSHLERRVALKVMLPDVAKRADARERFVREAKAAAAIEHDHIVTILQVGEDRGVPFLAMQWLKGMSLEERLQRPGPLNIAQVVRLGRQIARGLAAAHERGLIHRDIKPANLWIGARAGCPHQDPRLRPGPGRRR